MTTTTKPTVQEITDKAEELYWDLCHEYIGVRTQEQPFELGPIDHTSMVWEDGEETEEELDGLCVTDYRDPAVAAHTAAGYHWSTYFGEHVALIGFDRAEYGEDAGELIATENVEVLHIFC